ncbi:MAG: hypothetical protein LBS40_05740, partial [Burkholderiales bacterium]|jgi:hypothetical protein|nr:hypothetical protein [Burkholderiales bacterium]
MLLSIFGLSALVFLTGCVVPSYRVPAYVGSLDKCLDIDGTYEAMAVAGSIYLIEPEIYQKKYKEKHVHAHSHGGSVGIPWNSLTGKRKLIKDWIRFTRKDNNTINIQEFDEEGEEFNMDIDMREKGLGISCDENSWTTTTSWTDWDIRGITYIKIKANTGKELLTEYEVQTWKGEVFGLYIRKMRYRKGEAPYRKVDLTVEDIRANNEKAKKAITQYDEFSDFNLWGYHDDRLKRYQEKERQEKERQEKEQGKK